MYKLCKPGKSCKRCLDRRGWRWESPLCQSTDLWRHNTYLRWKGWLQGPVPTWLQSSHLLRSTASNSPTSWNILHWSCCWKPAWSSDGRCMQMVREKPSIPQVLVGGWRPDAHRLLGPQVCGNGELWRDCEDADQWACSRKEEISNSRVCWLLWKCWCSTYCFQVYSIISNFRIHCQICQARGTEFLDTTHSYYDLLRKRLANSHV